MNMLTRKSRQTTRNGPPAWGLGDVVTTPHFKKTACYEMLHRASEYVHMGGMRNM